MKRIQLTIGCVLFFCTVCGMAQEVHEKNFLKGRVVDAQTGEGLLGVTVSVPDYRIITDAQGYYRIATALQAVELTYTYEGYSRRQQVVQITADSMEVREIALYPALFAPLQEQTDAFSPTASLTIDDLLSTRFAADVRSTARSGQTGIGNVLFIRGYHSLNANTQPLLVVDGTPIEQQSNEQSIHEGYSINRLLDFDVNDIDRIEVLKDATSLYGSKGAAGVILVTTKRGQTTSTKITLDAMLSTKQKPHLPSTLDSDQYRTYLGEVLKGSDKASSLASKFEAYFNDSKADKSYNTYHNQTNWNNEVYQSGTFQQYALGIQGGDEVAKYNLSVGYLNGNDVVKSTSFDRINTRVNSDIHLSKQFDIEAGIHFSRVNRELRDDGCNATTSPSYIAQIKAPFLNPYTYTDDGSTLTHTMASVDDFGTTNPNVLLVNAKGAHKQYRFGINATPRLRFFQDWTATYHFSYYQDNANEHYFSPLEGVSPTVLEGKGISYNTVMNQDIRQSNLYGDARLAYQHRFGLHDVSAMVGQRMSVNTYKSNYGEGHNTGNDKIFNLSTSLDFLANDGGTEKWNSSALYAQATYTYAHRYTLQGTLSADASSRFGKEAEDALSFLSTQWALFPSLSAVWNVTGEQFMRNANFIDCLQLRTSFGLTGNDDIDVRYVNASLVPVNYVDVASGVKLGNPANNKLQWETTRKLTVGMDLAVWKDRLNLTVDLYRHHTTDLLTFRTSGRLTGYNLYLTNGGAMDNQGFEATLGLKAVNNRSFKWNTQVAFNHYKNQIASLPEGSYLTQLYEGNLLTEVGRPVGVFYGYKTDGIFSTTAEAEAANLRKQNSNASYSHFSAGDVHFLEPNAEAADGIIDEKDMTVIGNPNPLFTGAFTNQFQYRHFTLDVWCTFSYGGDLYNYERRQLESMSTLYNQRASVLNRWTHEGQITVLPRATYGDPLDNNRFSDRWIEDGSYFKIKDLRLSYHLPLHNPYIDGFTVWGSVSNAFTFTRYLGNDPETAVSNSVLSQGIDNGLMPACRTFSMGIKLNL